jgi:hypothetical protein
MRSLSEKEVNLSLATKMYFVFASLATMITAVAFWFFLISDVDIFSMLVRSVLVSAITYVLIGTVIIATMPAYRAQYSVIVLLVPILVVLASQIITFWLYYLETWGEVSSGTIILCVITAAMIPLLSLDISQYTNLKARQMYLLILAQIAISATIFAAEIYWACL